MAVAGASAVATGATGASGAKGMSAVQGAKLMELFNSTGKNSAEKEGKKDGQLKIKAKKVGKDALNSLKTGLVSSGNPYALAAAGAIQVGQFVGSLIKKRKAKKEEPELVNQTQATALSTLKRKQKTFESGAAAQGFVRNAKESQSQATLGALRSGSGLRGIARAQSIAGRQISEVMSQMRLQGLKLGERAEAKGDLIARRKLDLQRVGQAKTEADQAKKKRASTHNAMAMLLGKNDKSGGETSQSTALQDALEDAMAKMKKGKASQEIGN